MTIGDLKIFAGIAFQFLTMITGSPLAILSIDFAVPCIQVEGNGVSDV